MSSAFMDPEVPVIDIDPYTNANIENPYPFDEALREAGPVVWLKAYNMYAVGHVSMKWSPC